MKKLLTFAALLAVVALTSCKYDDDDIWNSVHGLENRVAKLEELCKQMNTNISSLQTIVTALQNNDYVTGTTPLMKDGKEIGYTITFSKGNPITIYHGKDGQDGEDGTNGKDGTTPAIGVKQDADGVYYWTLNGDWLTDENGDKIKAEGTDGKDGADGEDGADGSNGTNGTDGVTPKLEIREDYWWISYDNGTNWTQLGKATGEDGKDGEDGIGGDSMFTKVDYKTSTDYVIFTLADGTQIKLPTWSAFEALQRLCNETNTNLSALQTIVTALQNNDYITSVDPLTESGKVVGYTIKFAKSNPIVIYNGKDGADGVDGNTPVIGVKKDGDGIYYWTLDGEFIIVDGQKIKAQGTDGNDGSDGADGDNGQDGTNGKDGVTPKLEIRDGYWWISYDNGTNWTQLGKATGEDGTDGKDGNSIFKDVKEDDNNVYFTLTDDSVITISKNKNSQFAISFNTTDIAILNAGETKTISYTINGATDNTIVKAISQNGWKAQVNAVSISEGSITIIAPTPIIESEILVLVNDGTYRTLMTTLNCVQGVITIADDAYQFSMEGGNQEVKLTTNLSYTVQISNNAQSWLSVVETRTRAMRDETLVFNASPNTGSARYATVELKDDNGQSVQTIIFKQSGVSGNLANTTDINAEQLVVTNSINGDDIAFIRSMPNLKYLDLKDATIVAGGEPYYESYTTEANIIGDNMFNGLSKLETLILPNDVTAIGTNAFKNCSALTSLTLGNAITAIGTDAFTGCYNLAALTLPNVETLTNDICGALKSGYISHITVSEGTKKIDYSFTEHDTLIQIDIPQSVLSMSNYVFRDCSALSIVNFAPNVQLTKIGSDAFNGCLSLKSIIIPANVESLGARAFYNCTKLETVTFDTESKLQTIEDGKSAYINDNYHGAFANCIKLNNIVLPNVLKKIGSAAFMGCHSLKEIVIPENAIQLGISVFGKCTTLQHVQLPNQLSSIPERLFAECSQLLQIDIPSNVKTIKKYGLAFTALTSISLPSDINTIEESAFIKNPNLETIKWPRNVTTIPNGTFYCSGIKHIEIPNTIVTIEKGAFEECESLEEVTFEENSTLKTIGGSYESPSDWEIFGAFKRCSALKSITLPASVSTIQDAAFYDCSALSTIDASQCKNLVRIGKYSFSKCIITHFKIGSTFCPTIQEGTFTLGENATLQVPNSAINNYSTADGWSDFTNIIALD